MFWVTEKGKVELMLINELLVRRYRILANANDFGLTKFRNKLAASLKEHASAIQPEVSSFG